MATKTPRIKFSFKCTICNHINYTSSKNPRNTKDPIELMKHCPFCKKHTLHKEIKIK